MAVWVIAAVGLAYYKPELFIGVKAYTEWFFAFTMLGIGAVLNFEDFVPVFKKPQVVLLGVCTQFTVMPLLGLSIAKLLGLSPQLTVGLVLVGCVPGAMASNVISYLAKADVAYSIALTTTATFLSPLVTPGLTYIFAHSFLEVRFWPMMFSIIKMVIVPLFAGFLLRRMFREKVERFSHIFPAFSVIFIAFICGLVVALNREVIIAVSLLLFIAIFLHNLLGLLLGYYAGRLYRFGMRRRRTLAIEVGMQNAGLGAVLALKHFSSETALPCALVATWCVITAAFLVEWWARKQNVRKEFYFSTVNKVSGKRKNVLYL